MIQGLLLAAALISSAKHASADTPQTAAEKQHQADLQLDKDKGKGYAEQADKEYKPSTNKEYTERVNRIGKELAAIANVTQVDVTWGDKRLNPFDYKFKLVEGKDVNAFSLPGGYIYVFEGLVDYTESDDELAGVLAHEISHASFRHVTTLEHEMNKVSILTLPIVLISILTGATGVMQGAMLGTQAIGSGWSVKAEKAADHGGFQYLQRSKYNPVGMLTVMERLAMDERSRPKIDWGIYRSHPPGRERADAMIAELKANGIPIRRSQVTKTFKTQVKPGENGSVEAWFAGKRVATFGGSDALARADVAADHLNAFFDTMPELFQVKEGGEGEIVGNRAVILHFTSLDAAAAHTSLSKLTTGSLRAIKDSIYTIAYRVWDISN